MNERLAKHFWPGVGGAAVAFLVRLVVGDLGIALIGVVVFAVIYAVLVALSQAMKWPDAPMVYAATAAIATTVAFLISHAS